MFGPSSPGARDDSRSPYKGLTALGPDLQFWKTNVAPAKPSAAERYAVSQLYGLQGLPTIVITERRI